MHARRAVRANQAQDVCFFCAFRYLIEPTVVRPRIRQNPRRQGYSSTRQPRAAASHAVRRSDGDNNRVPTATSTPSTSNGGDDLKPARPTLGGLLNATRSIAATPPPPRPGFGGLMKATPKKVPEPAPPDLPPAAPLPRQNSTQGLRIHRFKVGEPSSLQRSGTNPEVATSRSSLFRDRSSLQPPPPANLGPRFKDIHEIDSNLAAGWKGIQRRSQPPVEEVQRFETPVRQPSPYDGLGYGQLKPAPQGFVSLTGDRTPFDRRASRIVCYNCHKEGHKGADCPEPDKRQRPHASGTRIFRFTGSTPQIPPERKLGFQSSKPDAEDALEKAFKSQPAQPQTSAHVRDGGRTSTIPSNKPAMIRPDQSTSNRPSKAEKVVDPFVDRNQPDDIEDGRKTRKARHEDVEEEEDDSSRKSHRRQARSRRQDDDEYERPSRMAAREDLDDFDGRTSRRRQFSIREEIDDDMQLGSGRKPKGKSGARSSSRFEEEEGEDEETSLQAQRADRLARKHARAEEKQRLAQEAAIAAATKTTPTVRIPEHISIANLANALGVRIEEFVTKVADFGFEGVTSDFVMNAENAALIAQEFGFDPMVGEADTLEDLFPQPVPEDTSALPQRPPVVTIMGHVDHGKTTILDYLRKSSIAATEHGGITQHIGAFVVPFASGKTITFLDTPGHAAFLSMRQRGANVTDIVVLVVAADDSVMPQTIEAIKHAKGANVPIIVAINKVDKEEANIERVKQDLARNNVEIEDFGGDTQVVCVSGKTGKGMDELQESIVTLSEILDSRATPEGPVEGWVLEASTKASGRTATILIRRGTLRVGDIVVAGTGWGRVRTLRNEAGSIVEEAGPGMPIEVDGWRENVDAGDEVLQADSEQRASEVVDYRRAQKDRKRLSEDMEAINTTRQIEQTRQSREKAIARARKAGLEDPTFDAEPEEEGPKGPLEVLFIVKADVGGSAEAVVNAIENIGNADIKNKILRSGVGKISEWDVEHAAATGGHILNFNQPVDPRLQQQADQSGVTIVSESIIYRVVEAVTEMLTDRLPPVITQKVNGEAEIAQLFEITIKGRKKMFIAGCKVRNGVVERNSKVRVMRGTDKTVVYDGTLTTLKNVKKDVTEMRKGTECGISFEDWQDMKEGDLVQCYTEVSEKRYL